MLSEAQHVILETRKGVRLLGSYSPQKHSKRKGLVLLIHGWEGSIDSTYMINTGHFIYRNGYEVFRLNLRDHGKSHHLNKGLFFSTLLDEVFDAARQVGEMAHNIPVFLAGFSLGGNFVLRIVKKVQKHRIKNFRHAVCISPVLNPDKATEKIDNAPLIQRYFLKKWRTSLIKKQRLFPSEYNFADILDLRSIREITEKLLPRHTDFKNATEYFQKYSLLNDTLKDLLIPTTIITSEDDPIIPVKDFYFLTTNQTTNIVIHRYGGHNGFIDGFLFITWYERKMVELFDEIVRKEL
jgi:predicted alpha/beta-fold hydrolase